MQSLYYRRATVTLCKPQSVGSSKMLFNATTVGVSQCMKQERLRTELVRFVEAWRREEQMPKRVTGVAKTTVDKRPSTGSMSKVYGGV